MNVWIDRVLEKFTGEESGMTSKHTPSFCSQGTFGIPARLTLNPKCQKSLQAIPSDTRIERQCVKIETNGLEINGQRLKSRDGSASFPLTEEPHTTVRTELRCLCPKQFCRIVLHSYTASAKIWREIFITSKQRL